MSIASLTWSSGGMSFDLTVRADQYCFLDDAGFGEEPPSVRITAVDGQSFSDEPPASQELPVVEGQSQCQ